jgi:hypothetical protein
MLDTSFTRLVATTLKNYSRRITDNVVQNQVLLWKLGQMGGVEYKNGGTSLVEPVQLTDNETVQSYAGFDPINMTNPAGPTAAEYAWKQLAGSTGISGIEMFKNGADPTRVVDLWDALGQNLEDSMKRVVNLQLFQDGSGNSGKDITGLLLAVENGDAWSTYGEIDSNAVTNWRNQFRDVGDISAGDAAAIALLRLGMTQLVNDCTFGGGKDYPTMIVTTKAIHEFWETKSLVPNEHYERVQSDSDMARQGFVNFIFKGIPVCWDINTLPNTSGDDGSGLLCLNLNYLKFVMGQDMDFKFTDPVRPDDQDAQTVLCLLYCQLVLSKRKAQGRADIHYTIP